MKSFYCLIKNHLKKFKINKVIKKAATELNKQYQINLRPIGTVNLGNNTIMVMRETVTNQVKNITIPFSTNTWELKADITYAIKKAYNLKDQER